MNRKPSNPQANVVYLNAAERMLMAHLAISFDREQARQRFSGRFAMPKPKRRETAGRLP